MTSNNRQRNVVTSNNRQMKVVTSNDRQKKVVTSNDRQMYVLISNDRQRKVVTSNDRQRNVVTFNNRQRNVVTSNDRQSKVFKNPMADKGRLWHPMSFLVWFSKHDGATKNFNLLNHIYFLSIGLYKNYGTVFNNNHITEYFSCHHTWEYFLGHEEQLYFPIKNVQLFAVINFKVLQSIWVYFTIRYYFQPTIFVYQLFMILDFNCVVDCNLSRVTRAQG